MLQIFALEQMLLRGHGGGDDVVDVVQHISAVTRAHQLFGGVGQRAFLMISLAACLVGLAGLAGAGGGHNGVWRKKEYGDYSGMQPKAV